MTLRQGTPDDQAALVEICHRTGWNGQDASPEVSDRRLLGQYFAAPYLVHAPAWCWVVDDGGPAGYLVATPDTRAFAAWMDQQWLPTVRTAFPDRAGEGWSPTETWIRQTIHSTPAVPDFVDAYPAHLHIDLLPRVQGRGLGRRLFDAFETRLRAEGVAGYHLGVSETNGAAQAFYAKVGLGLIRRDPGVVYLGRRLSST
jgi:ribosomal protein S18 acetylase RimI-like enzyme